MNNREITLLISSLPLYNRLSNDYEPRLKDHPKENSDFVKDFNLLLILHKQSIDGKYKLVLEHFNDHFVIDTKNKELNWVENFQSCIKLYCENAKGETHQKIRQEILLIYGVSALQLFVQNNFTGPIFQFNEILPSLNMTFDNTSERNKYILGQLAINSEQVYKLTRLPELLLLVKILFEELSNSELCSHKWWYFRFLRVYQSVISESSSCVYYKMISLIEDSLATFNSLEVELGSLYLELLHVEASLVCSKFGDISKAKKFVNSSRELSGLEVEMSGALGVRTKFQQTPYAQLVLKINQKHDPENRLFENQCSDNLPRNVKLQDETLLPKISFLAIEENVADSTVYPEEQTVILAMCLLKQKSSAIDDLLKEELIAYTECILSQPSIWGIQFSALFLRSQQEKKSMKKSERSMMQLQALVDEINQSETNVSSHRRLDLFYCTSIPTFWILEKELANSLVSLGAIKSALDIFLRLQLWEEIVFCYKQLQRNNKAEEIIREQLKIEETPTLLCLLGDVTSNCTYYEKAWEVSNCHSARAQRSLGYYYFERKQYLECIPFFSKAVEISSLDQTTWFSLAHAATETENYELATSCYQRVINLDPDSFEAWNNISNAYIKTKQKKRAFKSLQEALKCSYENWKIWENFLLVCVDVGAFEEAIQAWHRLIEIKGKHLDEEILTILVKAIVADLPDINQQPASALSGKAQKLLGHITATATNSAKTWSLYGQLLSNNNSTIDNVEIMERVVQYHQKSYRYAVQKTGWEKSGQTTIEVLSYVQMLNDSFLALLKSTTDSVKTATIKQSNKLTLKSVVAIVTKQLNDSIYVLESGEEIEKVVNLLQERLIELENS